MDWLSSDRERFDRLYETNRTGVFAYLYGQTGGREDAIDLTQETFTRVWSRIGDLQDWDAERGRYWVFGVARNVLLDFRRRLNNRKAALGQLAAQAESPSDTGDRLIVQDLDRAIAMLPEDRRLVLTMTVLGGMSSGDIGRVLGQPAGTVRSTLHDARRRLREALKS